MITIRQWIGRLIGCLGMTCLIAGNFFPPTATRAWCFIAGCLLLLIPPIIEFNRFLIALQLVALSGAILFFFNIPTSAKAIIPLLVVAAFGWYFYRQGMLEDRLTLFGLLGVTLLGLGYGVTRPEIYFFGGLVLAIYAWLSFRRGVSIAIMWVITNVIFCLSALVAIINEWA